MEQTESLRYSLYLRFNSNQEDEELGDGNILAVLGPMAERAVFAASTERNFEANEALERLTQRSVDENIIFHSSGPAAALQSAIAGNALGQICAHNKSSNPKIRAKMLPEMETYVTRCPASRFNGSNFQVGSGPFLMANGPF